LPYFILAIPIEGAPKPIYLRFEGDKAERNADTVKGLLEK
jgi:hypothetical protein